jgi:integrase
MRAKFTLLHRVRKENDGKTVYAFENVPLKHGRPVKPATGTSYYLRFSANGKRKTEALGSDFDVAATALLNHEARQGYVDRGLPVPVSNEGRLSIADAAAKYNRKIITTERAKRTARAYKVLTENFIESCSRTYIDEIGADEVLAFIDWLKANLRKNAIGEQSVTIRARLRYLKAFLKSSGLEKFPLPTAQWPRAAKKKAQPYSMKDVIKLMKKASKDEKDLIQFCVRTGFRHGEVANALYSHFDWEKGTITVIEEPNWKSKDRTERTITLSKKFMQRMKERRERYPKSELIFPNSQGRANSNAGYLASIVRGVAERAGVKLPRKPLHAFRSTFANAVEKEFGIATAQELLGHEDIETTRGYLVDEDVDSAGAAKIFEGFGD